MSKRPLKCYHLRVYAEGSPFYRKGGRIHCVHAHSLTEAKKGLAASGFAKMRAVFLQENTACTTADTDYCEHLLLWHPQDVRHIDPPPPETPDGYLRSFTSIPDIPPHRQKLRDRMMRALRVE